MKSQKQLESFTAYCKAHPEERFWQALVNWNEDWHHIFGSNDGGKTLHDVFYDEE